MSPQPPTIGPRTGRLAPVVLTFLAGCAGAGPLTSRYTTVGSLKASVAQLETEKAGLKREVKSLQTENRRLQDRMVHADQVNGELAARLDDARDVIRRQGGDPEIARPNLEPRTAPAAQGRRKPKRSPVTQIPGIPAIPEEDDREFEDDESARPLRPYDRDDDQGRLDDGSWAPMARSKGRSAPPR